MTLTTRTAATRGLGRCVGRDCAAHRHALRKAHPGEDRIQVLGIWAFDAVYQAAVVQSPRENCPIRECGCKPAPS
jgi:hypothetical protein